MKDIPLQTGGTGSRTKRGALWLARDRRDEFPGTPAKAWLAEGNEAVRVRAGTDGVDAGTCNGYRAAISLPGREGQQEAMPGCAAKGALTDDAKP